MVHVVLQHSDGTIFYIWQYFAARISPHKKAFASPLGFPTSVLIFYLPCLADHCSTPWMVLLLFSIMVRPPFQYLSVVKLVFIGSSLMYLKRESTLQTQVTKKLPFTY